MGIVSVNNDGVMLVDYDTGTPLPDETHILAAPAGGKWTFLADGATGLVTVTDGATGTPETVFYISPDGTAWRLFINDAGTLFLDDSAQKRIMSPVGNDQVKLADGSIAVGYRIATLHAGTLVPAPTWGAREGFVMQPNPIVLGSLGLPALPIFIEVGSQYDFVLLDTQNTEVYRWPNVSAGVNFGNEVLTEWNQGTVPTFLSATQFSVGGDQRVIYQIGRRVKLTVAAGVQYGTVSQARFSGGVTTVTMLMDYGLPLTDPVTDVDYALLTANQSSVPNRIIKGLTTEFVGPINIPVTQPFNLLPPGVVGNFGATIPPRWLLCDGALKLRTDYPELFKAISTVYGFSNSLDFRVPDLRGRLALGKDDMGGVPSNRVTAASVGGANAKTLGGVGGEQTHVVTLPESPAHTHGVQGGSTPSTGPYMQGAVISPTYTVTTNTAGGDGAHNNMSPWLAMNKAIWGGGAYVLDTQAFSDGFSLGFY